MGSGFTADHIIIVNLKGIGPIFTNGFAECPVSALGHSPIDMLTKAAHNGRINSPIVNKSDPDIFLTVNIKRINHMLTVGAGFAFSLDHGLIIPGLAENTRAKMAKKVRHDDAPIVYRNGRVFTYEKGGVVKPHLN